MRVELCNNAEWLYLYGPLEEDVTREGETADSVAELWWDHAHDSIQQYLEEQGIDCDVTLPDPKRRSCHGWNGTKFKLKGAGAGTFSQFNEEDWGEIVAFCHHAADVVSERESM